MIKVYIGETEVLSNKTFTITEELLKTSSTILNNCYPKCWEATRDYTNRFFFPKDYSQCKIQDEEYVPSLPGITVSSTNASLTINDANTDLNVELTNIDGNTTQNGTPTPSSPVPINVVSGRQDIVVAGKNLFDLTNIVNNGTGRTTYTIENDNIVITATSSGTYRYIYKQIDNLTIGQEYTIKIGSHNDTSTNKIAQWGVVNSGGSYYGYVRTLSSVQQLTFTPTETSVVFRAGYLGNSCSQGDILTIGNIQLEKGNTATTYEEYNGNTYEINLGKNLLQLNNATASKNGVDAEFNNGIITVNGLNTSQTAYALISQTTNLPQLQKGKTYTLSSTIPQNKIYLQLNYSDGSQQKRLGKIENNATSITFTVPNDYVNTANFFIGVNGTTTNVDLSFNVMLEAGSQATSYSAYKNPIELCKIGNYKDRIFKNTDNTNLEIGKWYIEKQIGKIVLNGSENWNLQSINSYNIANFYTFWGNNYPNDQSIISSQLMNYFVKQTTVISQTQTEGFLPTYSTQNQMLGSYIRIKSSTASTVETFKNWLSTHNTIVYYVLATPTYTEITDSELISQLNALQLLEGLNNISITSGNLPGEITIHYNYQDEYTDIDLLFCGVVKNSGDISLRPTDPKFCSLQILDYKTLLSEGQTLDFVISNKTITEAINMVIDAISDYGFIAGNISLSNGDETIGSYSTLNKTPYDVFQYLADISQSKWFTRVIDEDTVAIDFYSPELMERANDIQYTEEYFRENNIIDLSFSFGTRDYRNKQTILSDKVYGEIESDENITANGYQTSYEASGVIGILNHIYVNGVEKTIGTATEKNLGIYADFYYTPGNSTIESSNNYIAGTTIRVVYTPLVKGRQIVYNNSEINRINNQTGRNGIIARYETRNDILSSDELNKVAQTYIQYKGTPEIILTVQTKDKDLFKIGQQVYFDMPDVPDLSTDYMVKNKDIEITKTGESGVVFYTYQLSSNYNSETAINYFDNQRNKTNGNISEDEFITRNIDVESTANIIFDNLSVEEITFEGNNTLNCVLNSPFTQ